MGCCEFGSLGAGGRINILSYLNTGYTMPDCDKTDSNRRAAVPSSKTQEVARAFLPFLHCARASLTFATPASSHHSAYGRTVAGANPAIFPSTAYTAPRYFPLLALVSFICKVAHPISLRKSFTHRCCLCTLLPSQQPCTIHLRCASDSRSRSLARISETNVYEGKTGKTAATLLQRFYYKSRR
ncbi:hypothetical protein MA16_Dca016897 [Dendrobium catenatum]|uniref:Uncharacterized protein n=1 Tax=Dendrobium catenatum TaxID=906689 RepID=A0A2I0W4V9_9ASPA|nr:hypothetical protein MA16_Dca016897 [Dendrobium catenatum]